MMNGLTSPRVCKCFVTVLVSYVLKHAAYHFILIILMGYNVHPVNAHLLDEFFKIEDIVLADWPLDLQT